MSDQAAMQIMVSNDHEKGVWFVVESDIPGLNSEAESFDALVAVVSDVAPDLIEANLAGRVDDVGDIPLQVLHPVHVRRARAT